MNNKKGITELAILLAGLLVIAIIAFWFMFGREGKNVALRPSQTSQQTEVSPDKAIEMGKIEISQDASIEALEKELDETVVGDPSLEIESLNQDASPL